LGGVRGFIKTAAVEEVAREEVVGGGEMDWFLRFPPSPALSASPRDRFFFFYDKVLLIFFSKEVAFSVM